MCWCHIENYMCFICKQLSIPQDETVICTHAELQFVALEMSLLEHNMEFICHIISIPLFFHFNS
jgi:hypothetical protein